MKAIRLIVKNIGIVADATIELNKPLLLFYGDIRNGKTTILNAVKWVFGGAFPTDIIRWGETEAAIQLDLDCGVISRTFYVARDGSTKSRPLVFTRDGVAVRDAVAEVKKFLNPFLLDQDYLRNMTELERKKYFAAHFAVDTTALDREILYAEQLASENRAQLKGYGDIDLTPVAEPEDEQKLGAMRAEIIRLHQEGQQRISGDLAKRRQVYAAEIEAVTTQNALVEKNNRVIAELTTCRDALRLRIEKAKAQLVLDEACLSGMEENIAGRAVQNPLPAPPMPDTSGLEAELMKAADTKAVDELIRANSSLIIKRQNYEKTLQRQKDRQEVEAAILRHDATARELRAKRIAKLKECSEQTGIAGLAFDEAGNFSYEGCQAGMLSTSQLMKLSSALSAMYPEGFGIDLIDRAESLGRSVFDFVERAKAENKTILATIVGERPAVTPPEVGVFVVESGVVK